MIGCNTNYTEGTLPGIEIILFLCHSQACSWDFSRDVPLHLVRLTWNKITHLPRSSKMRFVYTVMRNHSCKPPVKTSVIHHSCKSLHCMSNSRYSKEVITSYMQALILIPPSPLTKGHLKF